MSKTLRTCNLCNQAEGDVVHGKKIVIEEYGVCTICKDELKNLEGVYTKDYENRTGNPVDMVIPWPAFDGFSWPPYPDVIVSGWEFQKHEFGLAITENLLLAGRRSIESYEREAFDRMQEIQQTMETTEDYREKMELRRELRNWQKKLEGIEKIMRMGERRLPMISLELVTEMEGEFSEDWVKVKFTCKRIKSTFFNKKKEVRSKDFFKFSRLYENAFDHMADMVRKSGGKVIISGRR
ncbi:MAG TPA: hypothetical protein VMW26_05505 [Methanomassiliicoccales archaeon]|nr:hypothetical protein [Methanomassiliicoccales archaeon]